MDHYVKKRSGLLSIVMILMIVFAMMPNMVFADTAEKNLVDYTGLQQELRARGYICLTAERWKKLILPYLPIRMTTEQMEYQSQYGRNGLLITI
ncbi:MAG: hypothetical protein V8Q42_03740 [Anaerovoracaceae bacterium]